MECVCAEQRLGAVFVFNVMKRFKLDGNPTSLL